MSQDAFPDPGAVSQSPTSLLSPTGTGAVPSISRSSGAGARGGLPGHHEDCPQLAHSQRGRPGQVTSGRPEAPSSLPSPRTTVAKSAHTSATRLAT